MDFIGRAWAFPFRFGVDNTVQTVIGEDNIKDSIYQILGTMRSSGMGRGGERLMKPQFGSRIREINFENNSEVTKILVKNHITEALNMYEPRITLVNISVSIDKNTCSAYITYVINRTNRQDNMVYPFFMK
jgi:hypothetical protein